jgi:hypothetical protein
MPLRCCLRWFGPRPFGFGSGPSHIRGGRRRCLRCCLGELRFAPGRGFGSRGRGRRRGAGRAPWVEGHGGHRPRFPGPAAHVMDADDDEGVPVAQADRRQGGRRRDRSAVAAQQVGHLGYADGAAELGDQSLSRGLGRDAHRGPVARGRGDHRQGHHLGDRCRPRGLIGVATSLVLVAHRSPPPALLPWMTPVRIRSGVTLYPIFPHGTSRRGAWPPGGRLPITPV